MTPERSALFVVGDVEAAALERIVSSSFRDWTNNDADKVQGVVAPIAPSDDRWRVIVRPEATQSVIRVGGLAPDRKTPDYEALVLLNTVLGGQFGSRLNEKLREEMGATYGVHSSFALRRQAGSFLAGADVEAARSKESLAAILGEIEGIAKDRPIDADELNYAKAYITRRFPARFETQSGILSHLTHMVVYGLPLDYYDGYLDRIAAVTLEDVHRAAQRHLTATAMKVVVVAPPEPAAAIEEFLAGKAG
jgi:predicted Zn-dependent peptidase